MRKKIFLLLTVLLFGCSSHVKSDLYNSIDPDSVSDTLNNLTEIYKSPAEFNGSTTINNDFYEVWSLGEDVSVLSNIDQSVAVYRKMNAEIEEIELLLKDYGIEQAEKLDEVLDRNNNSLNGDDYIDIFLQPDQFVGSNDEVVLIVERDFRVPGLDEYYKELNVTVYYDKELAEVAKSEFLK